MPRKRKKELTKAVTSAPVPPPAKQRVQRTPPAERPYRQKSTSSQSDEKKRSSGRAISPENLARRFTNTLKSTYGDLYRHLGQADVKHDEITERFVYATLGLSPTRYQGYNAEELLEIVRGVLERIERRPAPVLSNPADEKVGVRTPVPTVKPARGEPTNVSNGPRKDRRPLSERQAAQAEVTPPPPPISDVAATHTTKKGRPAKVVRTSTTLEHRYAAEEALGTLLASHMSLREDCEAGLGLNFDDDDAQGLLKSFGEQYLLDARQTKGLLKQAASDYAKADGHKPAAPVVATVTSLRAEVKPAKAPQAQKEAVQEVPKRGQLSAEEQAMFDRLDAAKKAEEESSEARREKEAREARILAFLQGQDTPSSTQKGPLHHPSGCAAVKPDSPRTHLGNSHYSNH